MKVALSYGHHAVTAEIDWTRPLATLDVAQAPELPDLDEAIRGAIEHPIGLDRGLYELVSPGERVVVLVSDMFRQTCVDQILPILIAGLDRAGVGAEHITFLFATGTHRAPTPEEQAAILGRAVYEQFRGRIFVHDPNDAANLVYLGTTSRGTPVEINRRAHEADRLIATGAVVLHYFGGYGGGRKSILPGIASARTIAQNHAMNLDPLADRRNPDVRIGVLDGNPVAEDMLEGGKLVGVDYVINTVLNRHGRIAGVFAGELDAAHRAAAAFAHGLYATAITEQADLVIASSGAAQDFVQSHKALYNAYQAVKPGGRIVLLSECREGLGDEQFVQWLRLATPERIIASLRKQAEINGQTALSTLEKGPMTFFVTEMGRDDVALMGGTKAASLGQALGLARRALADHGVKEPTCYLMPSASYTVPFLEA